MKDFIIKQFGGIGVSIDDNAAAKFISYYELLKEWNKKFNITAITDFEDVVVKHFIDSAYGLKYITGKKNICDVGSGGGFPALVLKILYPQITATMIDASNKKITFLKEAVKHLGLEGCECIHTRAEHAVNLRESFDCVTARAVAPLNTLCEYALPLVKVGGIFIAYKAKADSEIEKARNAINVLGGKIKTYEKYTIYGGQNRALIVIDKISKTDKKYPRGGGKEKSRPL